jgi:uncharacterized protein
MDLRALKRYLPTADQLRGNRALGWLAPAVADPQLWSFRRHGVAAGLAIGVFFGLLVPIAQILFAVVAAVALRANVPVAAATTFITNPFTFGPIYYLAYKLGALLLGDAAPVPDAEALEREIAGARDWLAHWWERFATFGKPLALGLVVFATVGAAVAYAAVHVAWRTGVVLRRRRRSRTARRAAG